MNIEDYVTMLECECDGDNLKVICGKIWCRSVSEEELEARRRKLYEQYSKAKEIYNGEAQETVYKYYYKRGE